MENTSIKSSPTVKTNSLKAWILAARPKTLTGAAAPVLVGAVLAWATLVGISGDFFPKFWIIPSAICLAFALAMQIDANFINDYFDWKKGADSEERLGPERACSKGWITPRAMKTGIIITTIISFLLGLPLIYFGGWWMIGIGLFCIVGAFLYTTKFSYRGWGDVMVVLFFGIIPVFFTWFVSTYGFLPIQYANMSETGGDWETFYLKFVIKPYHKTWPNIIFAGFAMGLVVNNLLIINNYRDRELDKKNGKKTLVVKWGARASEWLYLANGCLAVFGMMLVNRWMLGRGWLVNFNFGTYFPYYLIIPLLFLPFLFSAHRKMVKINHGKKLNESLGEAARNILIFSILFITTIVISILSVWYSR